MTSSVCELITFYILADVLFKIVCNCSTWHYFERVFFPSFVLPFAYGLKHNSKTKTMNGSIFSGKAESNCLRTDFCQR